MAPTINDRLRILRHSMGALNAPKEIKQQDFEDGPEHLHRLAQLRPGDLPEVWDINEYMADLLYTPSIDVPLLVYLFPFCLEAWHDHLSAQDSPFAVFVEYFYQVLVSKPIFEEHLTSAQAEAMRLFMRDSILEEIDAQRGLSFRGYWTRPRRWIYALTNYGLIAPDIERIWTRWWSLETVGQAVAALQYISCLMYPNDQNPVFAPWNRNDGGGPPTLWAFYGFVYEKHWQQANVNFLQSLLDRPGYIGNVLARAVDRLSNEPEHPVALKMLSDLPACSAAIDHRCAALPYLLAVAEENQSTYDWPS